MTKFTTLKFLTYPEHYDISNSTGIPENQPEIVTVTMPNLKQIDTVTVHRNWNSTTMQTGPTTSTSKAAGKTFVKKLASVQELGTTKPVVKISQSTQSVERLLSFSEEPSHENLSENLQSTVYDSEAITNTAESTTGKVTGTSLFLPVKEIAKHQLQSVIEASATSINAPLFREPFVSRKSSKNWPNFPLKEILNKKQGMNKFEPSQEHEIISATTSEIIRKNEFTHIDTDNLDVIQYNSVSPERRTSMITEIRRNALTTEAGKNSKNNEFDENNDNFSLYNQEELPVDNKLTTTVVSLVQNSNSLFPNIPVEEKSLQDKFDTSFISMTHWSFQNGSVESFENFAPNFKTSMDMQFTYSAATESTNLTTDKRITSKGVGNNDISYTDSDLNTNAGDNHYTSTYTDSVTRENHIVNNIDTTVTLSNAAETIGMNRRSTDAAIQPPFVSLTDNMHMKDYILNESLDEIDKLQETESNKEISAVLLHPETVWIETEAKGEQLEDTNVKNDLKMNKMQSQEISKLNANLQ